MQILVYYLVKFLSIHVQTGIPQRFSLGPLLLPLYVNDLPRAVQSSKTDMYAADMGIHESGVSVDELETIINNDFEKLCR